MAEFSKLIKDILDIQTQTKVLHAEMHNRFTSLTLDEKIELYCQSVENGTSELFDSFLGSESYYTGPESVSLYDDMYWEKYETRTLSGIFDDITDEMDDDTLFSPEDIIENIKTGESTFHVVFRDFIGSNIGRATYDW